MEITYKGTAIELKGQPLKVGEQIPEVTLVDQNQQEVELTDIINKTKTVISVIPDVTTRTCNLQTKRFNELANNEGFRYITVSRNQPDQFKQWNEENQLNVETYSDLNQEFGKKFGIVIYLNEQELLARAVIVVDESGQIIYQEIVKEVSQEPDYSAALDAIHKDN